MSVYDFSTYKNSAFAESVIYTHAGIPKTIKAVVFRTSIRQATGSKSDIPINFYRMIAQIDSADIAEILTNEDSITCLDIDGATKTFRVRAIISSDPGSFKLGL
jgi:hypothetical protein